MMGHRQKFKTGAKSMKPSQNKSSKKPKAPSYPATAPSCGAQAIMGSSTVSQARIDDVIEDVANRQAGDFIIDTRLVIFVFKM